VTIGRITFENGVMELYDAAVAQPPLKIRLEQIKATMRGMRVRHLSGPSSSGRIGLHYAQWKWNQYNVIGD